jgi:hypothetical protein
MVADFAPSKHKHPGGITAAILDHNRSDWVSILVSPLAASGMADIRIFAVCQGMSDNNSTQYVWLEN